LAQESRRLKAYRFDPHSPAVDFAGLGICPLASIAHAVH